MGSSVIKVLARIARGPRPIPGPGPFGQTYYCPHVVGFVQCRYVRFPVNFSGLELNGRGAQKFSDKTSYKLKTYFLLTVVF